ncbi:MAG TPA: uracil-DNA glycosylase family protein [Woeseiaceae bacterium]|nr:uracil-DNA glycosylase family protein [Woeseiaceae bacterium]
MTAPLAHRSLEQLLAEIRACRICMEEPLGRPLPHEPRPVIRAGASARLLIASQAPGTRVHATGIPFNDPSGDRLRDWMGVDRETFYDETKIAIVPMGFCFPGLDDAGGDLPPRRECARRWHGELFPRLHRIEFVLAIGQYAQAWHLGSDRRRSMTETVQAWRSYCHPDRVPQVLPLPHPSWRNNAWLKRNPWFEAEVLPFLRRRVQETIG